MNTTIKALNATQRNLQKDWKSYVGKYVIVVYNKQKNLGECIPLTKSLIKKMDEPLVTVYPDKDSAMRTQEYLSNKNNHELGNVITSAISYQSTDIMNTDVSQSVVDYVKTTILTPLGNYSKDKQRKDGEMGNNDKNFLLSLEAALEDFNLLDEIEKLGAYDKYTQRHSFGVMMNGLVLLALSEEEQAIPRFTDSERLSLALGLLFHDIGKIHISGNIIKKDSELSDAEYEQIQSHPNIGKINMKSLEPVIKKIWPEVEMDIILSVIGGHHQRADFGSKSYGDPDPKRGLETPKSIMINEMGVTPIIYDGLYKALNSNPDNYRTILSRFDANAKEQQNVKDFLDDVNSPDFQSKFGQDVSMEIMASVISNNVIGFDLTSEKGKNEMIDFLSNEKNIVLMRDKKKELIENIKNDSPSARIKILEAFKNDLMRRASVESYKNIVSTDSPTALAIKISTVADITHALAEQRSYNKERKTPNAILAELINVAGKQIDARFLDSIRKMCVSYKDNNIMLLGGKFLGALAKLIDAKNNMTLYMGSVTGQKIINPETGKYFEAFEKFAVNEKDVIITGQNLKDMSEGMLGIMKSRNEMEFKEAVTKLLSSFPAEIFNEKTENEKDEAIHKITDILFENIGYMDVDSFKYELDIEDDFYEEINKSNESSGFIPVIYGVSRLKKNISETSVAPEFEKIMEKMKSLGEQQEKRMADQSLKQNENHIVVSNEQLNAMTLKLNAGAEFCKKILSEAEKLNETKKIEEQEELNRDFCVA